MKNFNGKPCEGKLHARFDAGGSDSLHIFVMSAGRLSGTTLPKINKNRLKIQKSNQIMSINIDTLRTLCQSLPHTEEDVKWGNDLCFTIGKKMYCVTGLEGEFTCSFKVQPEEFEELICREEIIVAPYLGRYKWVLIKSGDALDQKEWNYFINQSYDLIKSKLPKKILLNL